MHMYTAVEGSSCFCCCRVNVGVGAAVAVVVVGAVSVAFVVAFVIVRQIDTFSC